MHKRHHARWPWLAAFVSLAIVLTGAIATGASAGKSESSLCATIDRYNVEKQMNQRAADILAACGRYSSRATDTRATFSALARLSSSPNDYGGTDVNTITGGEGAFPKVTQSEVQVWAQGNTVVALFNDTRTSPACYSGGAYSTNGGATFTNLNSRPFCSRTGSPGGEGLIYGDPVVYYDVEHSKWVATFLTSGCGAQGIGTWFSNDGITWTVGPCAHSGGGDDRQSGWVDNSPSSPHFGNQYTSWNNFSVGGGALFVARSTDGGLTWGAPVQLNAGFIRDVQITTGPNGYVYLATMDEGGGGLGGPRTNRIYRSTDGGLTWTSTTTGPTFLGPGVSTCGYFAAMYPSYWRHMGWGDIQAGPCEQRALRLRPARCGRRQGRHLLRSLDRQRLHLVGTAADRPGRRHARPVAALAGGDA